MTGLHDEMMDEGISRLYKKTRIEEPSMGLDSAILTQARQAVEKKKNLWSRARWMVPLTSFALAMLTATLFIQMKQEHPNLLAPSSVIAPAPEFQAEEGMKDDIQRELKKRAVTKGKEKAEKGDAAGAPAPTMELKSAPAEMEATPARNLMKPLKKTKQEAVGASHFRSREALSETDATAPAQTETLKDEAVPDPENWIVKIRALLKDGKQDKALKELKAFRASYPNYKLPDDLKPL